MATGSDNVFPKVILAEGAAPATPASGQVKAYAKADGLLYSKDDAGVETLMSGGAGGSLTVQDEGTPLATAATTMNFVGAGVVASGAGATKTITISGGAFDPDTHMPWHINLLPYISKSNTNWDTFGVSLYPHMDSTGAQNAEIAFDVVLAAGTWAISLIHHQDTNRGIYTISLDASSVGTIDGYAASATTNVRSTVTGISVATTGKKELKLKMATKNASSSSYFGLVGLIVLRRTA